MLVRDSPAYVDHREHHKNVGLQKGNEYVQADENDGSQDAPLEKRVFEEALVQVEADEELVCRRLRQDKPRAVGDQRGDGRTADDPAYLRLHPSR